MTAGPRIGRRGACYLALAAAAAAGASALAWAGGTGLPAWLPAWSLPLLTAFMAGLALVQVERALRGPDPLHPAVQPQAPVETLPAAGDGRASTVAKAVEGASGIGGPPAPAGHAVRTAPAMDPAQDEGTASEPGEDADGVALRQALEAGALQLVYQPTFDLEARRVPVVQVLPRWPGGARAAWWNGEIATLADRCGLGPALGGFVIEGACRQLRQWQQQLGAAAPQRVAVPLSLGQCLDPALAQRLQAALDAHALSPAALQLDVAGCTLAAGAGVVERLGALRAQGVLVALDRFGGADSTLGRLPRLPLDVVKLDGRLWQRAQAEAHAHLVVTSTLRLAEALGLAVVAEGVDTQAQLALVRALGCRLAQGAALCPPVEATALTHRLRVGAWLEPAAAPDLTQGDARAA